jgi:hypothetical protein
MGLAVRGRREVFGTPQRNEIRIIDISINRDTGVRRAIYVMNSGIFNKCGAINEESARRLRNALRRQRAQPHKIGGLSRHL